MPASTKRRSSKKRSSRKRSSRKRKRYTTVYDITLTIKGGQRMKGSKEKGVFVSTSPGYVYFAKGVHGRRYFVIKAMPKESIRGKIRFYDDTKTMKVFSNRIKFHKQADYDRALRHLGKYDI